MKRICVGILFVLGFVRPASASLLRLTPFAGVTYPDARGSYGIQLGIGGGLLLGFEGEIYRVPEKDLDPSATFYTAGLRIQPPLPIAISPYLAAGLGTLRENHGDSTDSYFISDIGGGAEVKLADHVSIQGEYRVFHASSHRDPSNFKRLSFGLGLKF